VYAYETITNANPIVKGFSFDDPKKIMSSCIDEACIGTESPSSGMPTLDAGLADAASDGGADAAPEASTPQAEAGIPGGSPDVDPCADPDAPTCFEVCTSEKPSDCPEHVIKLETDPSSVEPDAVTKAREGRDVLEQAWINYYTEEGEFVNDVKLLG